MKTYQEVKKNYLQAKEDYEKICRDSGQHVIHELLSNALKSLNGIEAIRWKQYTPYFDDGNACVFGLQQVSVKLGENLTAEVFKGKEPRYVEDDIEEGFVSEWNLGHFDEATNSFVMPEAAETLKSFLENLEQNLRVEEELLETVFGDHAQVTYRKGDFFIEECEHD